MKDGSLAKTLVFTRLVVTKGSYSTTAGVKLEKGYLYPIIITTRFRGFPQFVKIVPIITPTILIDQQYRHGTYSKELVNRFVKVKQYTSTINQYSGEKQFHQQKKRSCRQSFNRMIPGTSSVNNGLRAQGAVVSSLHVTQHRKFFD